MLPLETTRAFFDELVKLSVSRKRWQVAQSRKGRRPLRVEALLRKEKDGSLYKEAAELRLRKGGPESKLFSKVLSRAEGSVHRVEPEDLKQLRVGHAGYVPKENMILLGEDSSGFLAHEIGHSQLQKSRLGRLSQSWAAKRMPLLSGAAGFLGGMTGRKSLAFGVPLIMNAPQLGNEAMASVKGDRLLRDEGASPDELSTSRKALLKGFGGYAGMAGLGMLGGAAGLGARKLMKTAAKDYGKNSAGYDLQGKIKFQGLPVAIENRKGSVREGENDDGSKWKTKYRLPYGYLEGTKGADGEEVDVYVGPKKDADKAFVVHQKKDDGSFDEDTVMLGFKTKDQAKKAILQHYDDPKYVGGVSPVSMDKLKELVASKKKLTKVAQARRQLILGMLKASSTSVPASQVGGGGSVGSSRAPSGKAAQGKRKPGDVPSLDEPATYPKTEQVQTNQSTTALVPVGGPSGG